MTGLSPYWDNTFWQFFATFAKRLMTLFSGSPLAADELQILVLSSIAISCGLLGPLLVLKRMTMLVNSLSHTILLGLAVSFLLVGSHFGLSHLMIGALVAGLLTALLTGCMVRFFRLQEDASVGLVFTTLFALGIIVVTLFTRDAHLGLEIIMGNADALRTEDLFLAGSLALINGLFVLFFFWPLQFAAFDSSLPRAHRFFLQMTLLFLVAASCIGSFRAVGVLLVLSFLVGPYLIARLFCHRLWKLLLLAPLIGIAASVCGVALSRHLLSVYNLALSTGGIVTTLIALVYPIAYLMRQRLTHSRQEALQ